MMNRRQILLIFLAVMSMATAGTLYAGQSIQSPAEAAARTAPPAASPILVPVEERTLATEIVTRGTARYGLPVSISIVPSNLKANAGIIARLPTRNTFLNEGDLLLTASGRPVFILLGEIPVFRDLAPETEGDDVLQLEHALARLGYDPGEIDGRYDDKTGAAVADWYRAAGWQIFGRTSDQVAAIRNLEQAVVQAEHEKLAADEAVALAILAVNADKAEAVRASKAAAVEVGEKSAAWNRIQSDPNASETDKASAVAALGLAQSAQEATELAGSVAVQAAEDAHRATVRRAELANEMVSRLQAELERERRKSSVQVPADEIVFVPSLPVRIDEVAVSVGDEALGPVLTVTNNQLAVDSSLQRAEAALVKPGMKVAISEPDLGLEATGVVARVASTPGTDGVDGFHVYFETLVDATPQSLEGFSLRLTIPVESTEESAIVVPVNALTLTGDGNSIVEVTNGVDQLQTVIVEPGLSAKGYVQVKPLNGTLTAGQLVLIGFEQK